MNITIKQMRDYGYKWNDMQPLSPNEARETLRRSGAVYVLHSDNTEAEVTNEKDFNFYHDQGCLFGVEKAADRAGGV